MEFIEMDEVRVKTYGEDIVNCLVEEWETNTIHLKVGI